tara:strand:- start:223 stop:477 length:255 start_codon:yes stop_codon:yes gene_type:complete
LGIRFQSDKVIQFLTDVIFIHLNELGNARTIDGNTIAFWLKTEVLNLETDAEVFIKRTLTDRNFVRVAGVVLLVTYTQGQFAVT